MTTQAQPFETLSAWLGAGEPCPSGWQSITKHTVLILVGLTGVGKTTTVEALKAAGLAFADLPNRRVITDHLIIGWLQAQDGEPYQIVRDRTARFDYTRRYRDLFAGGMAHALSQLWLNPDVLPTSHLLFDGLRGENEVRHAAKLLPNAFFIVLDAPNDVRIQRLLGRADSFDQVEISQSFSTSKDTLKSLSDLNLDTQHLLSPVQEAGLIHLVNSGQVEAHDLEAKLRIVMTESNNYDPVAAIETLQAIAPERTVIVNTAKSPPAVVAQHIQQKLG